MFCKRFFSPKAYVDSVVDVDIDALKEKGIKGIIIDLDNTLVEWNGDIKLIDDRTRVWLNSAIEKGVKVCLVSNALNERATVAGEFLGIPVISSAIKPRKRPFLLALDKMGTSTLDTAVIGDQLFTDVLGGNRVGLYTILVKPISTNELITTKFIRRIERHLISYLEKRGHMPL